VVGVVVEEEEEEEAEAVDDAAAFFFCVEGVSFARARAALCAADVCFPRFPEFAAFFDAVGVAQRFAWFSSWCGFEMPRPLLLIGRPSHRRKPFPSLECVRKKVASAEPRVFVRLHHT
jgi:hypothetical protein